MLLRLFDNACAAIVGGSNMSDLEMEIRDIVADVLDMDEPEELDTQT